MSFLAPVYLLAAGLAGAAVLAAHFLVTRQPPSSWFPPTRFIPVSAATIVTPARRPRDIALALLRVTATLLIGAAFAHPRGAFRRRATERIVLVDRSRDISRIDEVRDSARTLVRPGDVVIAFDSLAHTLPPANVLDSLAVLRQAARPGLLSTALIAARRELAVRRDEADSFELVLVSPLAREEQDAATASIRRLWAARARVVRVGGAADSGAAGAVDIRGPADDPLRVTGPLRHPSAGAAVRVVRDSVTAADSEWVRGEGRALVIWPADNRVPGWTARVPMDTTTAVAVLRPEIAAVVASFGRRWRLDESGSRIVARWLDGEAAAVERTFGAGCIRDVAIPISAEGDFVLRPEVAALVASLVRPCTAQSGSASIGAADVAALVGTGPLYAGRLVAPATSTREPLVPWLLAGALVALGAEMLLR